MNDNGFLILTLIRLQSAPFHGVRRRVQYISGLPVQTDRSIPLAPVDVARIFFITQLKPQLTTHANQGLKIIPSGRPSGPA